MHKNKERNFYIAIFIMLVILSATLHIFIRPALDDFYYMTFTDSGFWGYLKNTVIHYTTLTGRAFVHFLLCPLLSFDMFPFKIWNIFLIISLSFVTALICKNREKINFGNAALSSSLFWLIGISVLSDGALWGAGSFNYLFPAFMVILYYYLFCRMLHGKTNNLIYLLAFLSAATVEMTGLLSIVTVIYCALINKTQAKEKKKFVILNLISSVLGYITLFLSSGVSKRLSGNDYQTISITDRTFTNFSLFCRRICSSEGLAVILIITFLIICICAIKQKKNILSVACMFNITLLTLTSLNIIYDTRTICIVSIFAFTTLCVSSAEFFKSGEQNILFFMICIFISLGICMVSPVMAYRMLMPTAIFLIVICVSVLNLSKISVKSFVSILCVLTVSASSVMIFYTQKFSENTKVIDKNMHQTKNYDQNGTLIMTSVPDEIYSNGTVPSHADFGVHYLSHNNISPETDIAIFEPDAKDIYNGNKKLSSVSIKRNNVVYVPIRTAIEVIDADVSWFLACAHVEANGKTYRFCSGAKAAETGLFFSPSIKLMHPVRIISGTTYISLKDFNNVFNTHLHIKKHPQWRGFVKQLF